MTDIPAKKTPLARLVLFMICVAVAGTLAASVHSITVDQPHHSIQAPQNSGKVYCGHTYNQCNGEPYNQCHIACYSIANREIDTWGGNWEEAFEKCVKKENC